MVVQQHLNRPYNFMIIYSSFYNDYGEEDWDVLEFIKTQL